MAKNNLIITWLLINTINAGSCTVHCTVIDFLNDFFLFFILIIQIIVPIPNKTVFYTKGKIHIRYKFPTLELLNMAY